MKTSFLITTITAALLAGTAGIASAQNTGADPKQEPKPAPNVQMKSQDKMQSGAQNSGQMKPGPAAQDKAANQGAQDKAAKDKAAQEKAKDNSKSTAQQPAHSPSTTGQNPQPNTGQNTQRQNEPTRQQPAGQQPKATQGQGSGAAAQSQSQGQAAAGKNAVALTAEQKTTIRQSVLGARGAPKVANVNFSINVGAQVPRTVHFAAVPEPLFRIHPAWRGLVYFIVGDEIIIVDSRTHEIVAVLDV